MQEADKILIDLSGHLVMKLPSVKCLITKLVILTIFQNIFVICSSRRVKRLTHFPDDDCSVSRLAVRGKRYNDTVIRGNAAKLGQFPWMVMVHQYLTKTNQGGRCGGTLISSRWVLTAGHCILYPRTYVVVMGEIDKKNIHGTSDAGRGISRWVTRIIVHPRYKKNVDGVLEKDIALLKMNKHINFNDKIKPIRLARRRYPHSLFLKHAGIITGWGYTGPNKKESRVLLWGVIPIMSNDDCSKYWSRLDVNQMCTKPETGYDLCQGDSGGPLVLQNRRDRTYLQIGIVSCGDNDCPSLKPRVLTRVSSYYKWIQIYVTDLK